MRAPLKNLFVLFLAVFLLIAAEAKADCVCRCVGGHVQPVCEKPTDHRPRCAQHMCPVTAPAQESIQSPDKEPDCAEQKVHNPYTGMDETKTVCQ